jgi:predicted Zn-dependent protease
MGRFDEALAEAKRAEELDPASPLIGADFGNVLLRARQYDQSIAQLNRVVTLDPNFWVSYWYLGMAYHGNGNYPEAVANYRKALTLSDNPWIKALLVYSLMKLGERSEASKLLAELKADSTKRYVSGSSLAIAHGALGDKDKAFFYLNKDVAERDSRPQVFAVNPIWDDLRDDPRFAEVLRRVENEKLE